MRFNENLVTNAIVRPEEAIDLVPLIG